MEDLLIKFNNPNAVLVTIFIVLIYLAFFGFLVHCELKRRQKPDFNELTAEDELRTVFEALWMHSEEQHFIEYSDEYANAYSPTGRLVEDIGPELELYEALFCKLPDGRRAIIVGVNQDCNLVFREQNRGDETGPIIVEYPYYLRQQLPKGSGYWVQEFKRAYTRFLERTEESMTRKQEMAQFLSMP